ncbi:MULTISPECIES: hypothetical protein [Providencia]|uniref:Uncharacterized protein n=2 Tax=Providencia heimbachae TaxID=333962 RepID=A0A1B7K263_9GAMM|nr:MULTISPECIES: hypothetical protein [Providencia]MBP6121813.1 hypothetical protein [Providencia sp.]MDD9341163.1 hypothetical protein [Providencia heimbachae]NIH23022.1 hypothetical protein [Providencia heimbachae]OAT54228.1 hypothetical protein M998_0560 [Providencia heimbachae ATCC 35613]QCJ70507.1 hypothetical protein C9446_11985 [Providencia heimbachae]
MKNLLATLAGVLMLSVLAIAMLFIIFPQQWKQNIYPSISQMLPEPMSRIIAVGTTESNICASLEGNLQSFANYLKMNQEVVDVKGMNSLDEQLSRIQARIDTMPSDVRNLVCQQEYVKLEGLKSVFSLEHSNLNTL